MAKFLFVTALFSLLPSLGFTQDGSEDGGLFKKITDSPAYKKQVAIARKTHNTLTCFGLTEVLTSSDYSMLPPLQSKFKLVVLQCSRDPHDNLGIIHVAGLAVVSNGDVLSFTVRDLAQPD